MKLIPVAFFIIAVFLAGLLFLEGRGYSGPALLVPIAFLLLLTCIILMLVGKIALLLAVITIAILFILSKRA